MVSIDHKAGIHKTADIDPKAQVHETAFIGAYAVINEGVDIGERCRVDAHSVIGAVPFDDYEEGALHPVVLEAGAWIGSHVIIQRGVSRPTIIGAEASVNHGCSIGHDVQIGPACEIGLSTTISGHSNLGEGVRIGPGCTVNNRSELGSFSRVGIGSLVLHPVDANTVVVGRPAIPLSEYKKLSVAVRELTGDNRVSRPVTSAASKYAKHLPFLKPFVRLLPRSIKVALKKILTR